MIKHEALLSMLNEITAEKGDFTLFGLFLREEAPNVWDLVVAAPWLDRSLEKHGRVKALAYFAKKVKARFTLDELLSLSRIIILETGNPVLEAILNAIPHGQEKAEFRDEEFSGLDIKRAYVFKAKQLRTNGKPESSKRRKKAGHRAAA